MTSFVEARDFILAHRTDYATAYAGFQWPQPEEFNFALDWFDAVLAKGELAHKPALRIVGAGAAEVTFAELSTSSNAVANGLRDLGVKRGDRILLMLGNVVPLWETMLAAMKLGAVVVPATTLLTAEDLAERVARVNARFVIASAADAEKVANVDAVRITVGPVIGCVDFETLRGGDTGFTPDAVTKASDPLLLYFTSGTTARPKLVLHTHASYPIGHLSTVYWLGLLPGDMHLNISSPGWAKHAWSCFFAPWNAGATIVAYQYERFTASALLDVLVRTGVTTFCAPPTVWRMLIQEPLAAWKTAIRELVGAGEPLNPEVIQQVHAAWGITLRDGFGQTETTAQVGNPPGMPVKPGSMGLPLPGYAVVLLNPDGQPADEGELCLPLATRPAGLMIGYLGDADKNDEAMRDGHYHTGDVARRDADGYITYIGRTDDVFKSSDYRISPFELESLLIEHPAVAEAAVVPSPDPLRLSVPKAFIALAVGSASNAETARSIFAHIQSRVSPYKRVRRLEFAVLPKTISGKIRRVELRQAELVREDLSERRAAEFWEEDFPGPRSEIT